VSLWRTEDGRRYFLLPDDLANVPGALRLSDEAGRVISCAPESLRGFETTEDQAFRWARAELGETLTELKHGLDERLAGWRRRIETVDPRPDGQPAGATGAAVPALLDLAKALPRVVGQSLSGDPARLHAARETMMTLQRRLRESGIHVDDRFGNFADRIASIREETAREK